MDCLFCIYFYLQKTDQSRATLKWCTLQRVVEAYKVPLFVVLLKAAYAYDYCYTHGMLNPLMCICTAQLNIRNHSVSANEMWCWIIGYVYSYYERFVCTYPVWTNINILYTRDNAKCWGTSTALSKDQIRPFCFDALWETKLWWYIYS